MRRSGFIFLILCCAGITACSTHSRVTVYPPSTPNGTQDVLVGTGDTLYGIARRSGVPVQDLAAWNCLQSPYVIHAGQRLVTRAPQGAHRCAPPTASTQAIALDAPIVTTTPLPAPRPVATTRTQSAWIWPAEGTVTSMKAGNASAGIHIAGQPGAPIRAVASGTVLYSGAGSKGLEEAIVIKHDNGWVSSYTHNRKRLVGEGQRVAAGAVIAEMGSVGTDRAKLGFELRRDGEPVDPRSVLPAR